MDTSEAHCREVLDRLYEYLDGELSVDERAAFERHFTVCRSCLRHREFEAAFKALIRKRCCEQESQARVQRLWLSVRTTRIEFREEDA